MVRWGATVWWGAVDLKCKILGDEGASSPPPYIILHPHPPPSAHQLVNLGRPQVWDKIQWHHQCLGNCAPTWCATRLPLKQVKSRSKNPWRNAKTERKSATKVRWLEGEISHKSIHPLSLIMSDSDPGLAPGCQDFKQDKAAKNTSHEVKPWSSAQWFPWWGCGICQSFRWGIYCKKHGGFNQPEWDIIWI